MEGRLQQANKTREISSESFKGMAMLKKMKVLKTISRFPDEFSIDQLLDHMKVLEQKPKDPAHSYKKQVPYNECVSKMATHWFG